MAPNGQKENIMDIRVSRYWWTAELAAATEKSFDVCEHDLAVVLTPKRETVEREMVSKLGSVSTISVTRVWDSPHGKFVWTEHWSPSNGGYVHRFFKSS